MADAKAQNIPVLLRPAISALCRGQNLLCNGAGYGASLSSRWLLILNHLYLRSLHGDAGRLNGTVLKFVIKATNQSLYGQAAPSARLRYGVCWVVARKPNILDLIGDGRADYRLAVMPAAMYAIRKAPSLNAVVVWITCSSPDWSADHPNVSTNCSITHV